MAQIVIGVFSDNAGHYAEVVRRVSSVVTVKVCDEQAATEAQAILDRFQSGADIPVRH